MNIDNTWPMWNYPSDKEMLELAHILTPYVKFLSQEIVEAVVKDNNNNLERWSNILKDKGVDAKIYLWQDSPCAFPGIRRHAGHEEIDSFKRRTKTSYADAIAIDDNTYPKEIWSFIFTGKRFSKQGPEGFELAHLVDHKTYKNRYEKELNGTIIDFHKYSHPFSGLYTSVSNLCYVPSNFLKPTDFSVHLRRLLQNKAYQLYHEVCNLFPFNLKLKNENVESQWNIKNFTWGEPVGSMDNINSFLEYRREKIENCYV